MTTGVHVFAFQVIRFITIRLFSRKARDVPGTIPRTFFGRAAAANVSNIGQRDGERDKIEE